MQTFSMTQIHELVSHAPKEGLWTSFGIQETEPGGGRGSVYIEMGVLCAKGKSAADTPDCWDISAARHLDSEDHTVVAHTELGSLFLSMLEKGEL